LELVYSKEFEEKNTFSGGLIVGSFLLQLFVKHYE